MHMVSEHYEKTVWDWLVKEDRGGEDWERTVVSTVHSILSALHYLHECGIVHRALTPSVCVVDDEVREAHGRAAQHTLTRAPHRASRSSPTLACTT